MQQEFLERATRLGLTCDCLMAGPIQCNIALVGEAPGKRECELGAPFVGGSGKLLWDKLKAYGITRTNVYSTNAVKQALSAGDMSETAKRVMPKQDEALWKELLLWELQQLPNLKVIVVLGNLALRFITDEEGISRWRGSVLDVTLGDKVVKVICCYNPAAVCREPKLEPTFNFDLYKIQRVIGGQYKPYKVEYLINPTRNDAIEYIHLLHSARDSIPVSLDIEVINNEVACVGLSNNAHEAICIAFRDVFENIYSVKEEYELWLAIARLCNDPEVAFIMQNGMYDRTFLWFKQRVRVANVWFDTMLAHHTLYPMLPHNLGYLTTTYTDHAYYKDDAHTWRAKDDIDQYWRYNCTDAAITWEIARKLHKELVRDRMDKFFFNHIMKEQPHLARFTVLGIPRDQTYQANFSQRLQEAVQQTLQEFWQKIHAIIPEPDYQPMPSSPKQMQNLYFNRLKLVGRGTSVDAANRERMKAHPRTSEEARQILRLHDKFSADSKQLGTYANMRVDDDNMLRCEYKQAGTTRAPGRLSSAGTGWGVGSNFQNQTEESLAMFIAPEGYSFGYFDLSQAEARYVAYCAKIPKWIEQFERARLDSSYDCHRALASELWGIPYDQVPTKDLDEQGIHTLRYVAKRCRHGLNYRMHYYRLAETANLSVSAAAEAYRLYHEATPELRKWWERIIKQVLQTKILYNCFGRRQIFLQRLIDNYGRPIEEEMESIVAFEPQSSIGDKVRQVWYQSEGDSRWPSDARIILNVHDSLRVLAPHAKVEHCLAIMKEYAEAPLIVHGEKLIIPAECKISVADEFGIHRANNLKKVML